MGCYAPRCPCASPLKGTDQLPVASKGHQLQRGAGGESQKRVFLLQCLSFQSKPWVGAKVQRYRPVPVSNLPWPPRGDSARAAGRQG